MPLFNTTPVVSDDSPCSNQQYEKLVHAVLREVGFEVPTTDDDPSITRLVTQHFESLPLTDDLAQKSHKIAKWASAGVAMSYPFLPLDVRATIGIFTTSLFMIDDNGKAMMPDLQNFARRLLLGQRQPHPILQSLLEFMPTFSTHYGAFACDMMLKATIEFIQGCVLENDYDGKLAAPATAKSFPHYLRLKTGYAEPYAHFIFPQSKYPERTALRTYLTAVPDLVNFINYSNDILSFYKESMVANERFNYIYNHSRTHEMTTLASLQATCRAMVESVQNVRATLAADPRMRHDVDAFVQGFLAYHVTQRRYRLAELGIQGA